MRRRDYVDMNPIKSDPLERIRNVDKDKDSSILKKIGSHVSGTKLLILKKLLWSQVAEQWTPALKNMGSNPTMSNGTV